MYETHFHLALAPFENTPDPRFFYASEQHNEALAAIEYTIRMRKGIVLITGPIGAGKTTVSRAMLRRCGDSATVIQLAHGHRTADELITHMLHRLGLPDATNGSHAQRLERLEQHLLHCAASGKPVVLFVDEAQTLSDAALEELRLISNFDTEQTKLLQLVLIGQPELRERLSQESLAPLRQRIIIARMLRPLSVSDVKHYIAHRISVASEDPEEVYVRFDTQAVERIANFTGGVPRLINAICDHCLLLGMVQKTDTINRKMTERVIADMLPGLPPGASVRLAA
ncbi:MAG: AAA family ATPase [Phycisphaeraceae bacterium]|nr:AAA family ATPase [Phycisphaeraceae bacterium]